MEKERGVKINIDMYNDEIIQGEPKDGKQSRRERRAKARKKANEIYNEQK